MATKKKTAKAKKTPIAAPIAVAPRFAKWIKETGPAEIAAKLQPAVTRFAVYGWLRYAEGKPNGYRPDPDRIGPIVRLSAGALTSADIYPEPKA